MIHRILKIIISLIVLLGILGCFIYKKQILGIKDFYVGIFQLYKAHYRPESKYVWVQHQIQKELEPFKQNKINSDLIVSFFNEQRLGPESYIMYEISPNGYKYHTNKPNILLLSGRYLHSFLVFNAYLKLLVDKKLISHSSTFLLYVGDEVKPQTFKNKSIPILGYATSKRHIGKGCILVPDIITLFKWHSMQLSIAADNLSFPWHLKKNKVFWRGGTTDGSYTESNFINHPRTRLVLYSKTNNKLDVGFTHYPQTTLEAKRKMEQLFGYKTHATYGEHIANKYLINLDGNSCTYPGLLWRLRSNSLVIKQETDNIQWFYTLLRPYVHYVPVKCNLTDLESMLQWLQNHDNQAQQININAQKLVQDDLQLHDMVMYLAMTLNEYGKVFDISRNLE